MNVPIEPNDDYVVIQKEVPNTRTNSGLYIPTGATEKTKIAKVLSVGKNIQKYKKGDRILYKGEYNTYDFVVEEKEYSLIENKEIVGRLK